MNGAAYIRVSTEDQTEFSPDAQLKAIKKYAKENNIILLKEQIYMDEGVSGRRADKRPAFMQMMGAAKSKPKPFDIILVHKFDRFARSREDSIVYKSLLRKECDVKVISITESIEDDKFSIILEAMLEAMAEYYSLNLAEEVRKGMTEKADRGELQCAASFGYDVVNNKLSINETEANVVKLVFDKFANREMNIRQLTLFVNNLGIRTKKGNLFENRTFLYMFHNPVYIGKLRWSPERVPNAYRNCANPGAIIRDGAHTPIIDTETWNKVQEILAENKEIHAHKQKSTTPVKTWLKGLIYCGNCGRALVQGGTNALQCGGYAKGTCFISCYATIPSIEKIVLEELKSTFKDKIEITVPLKKNGDKKSSENEVLQDRLQKLNVRESRIKAAYQIGIDTLAEYKENKMKLAHDRTHIQEQLRQLANSFVAESSMRQPVCLEIESLYALLTDEHIDMEIKYRAAHFVMDKIAYAKQDKTLQITYK